MMELRARSTRERAANIDSRRGRMVEVQTDRSTTFAGTIAFVLARGVIPLWFLAGAVLKLVDLSPTHLPSVVISFAGWIGLDLMFVLRYSIAVELVVVVVMVLVPPLARLIGLLMLAAFMPILAGDILVGASSCGCFGALQVNPWITLVTDVTFFVLLAVLGRREPRLRWRPEVSALRIVVAGFLCLVSVALAFGIPSPLRSAADAEGVVSTEVEERTAVPADGFYLPDYASWIGRPFSDLEIAGWIDGLPADLQAGQHYVMFYRKDCEHCHELLELYFASGVPAPTTAVAVPERDGWPTENVQDFPCVECGRAELPMGVDWFIKTPALVRLSDGIVECAAEVDAVAPECLVW
jgi:hypothetical protein